MRGGNWDLECAERSHTHQAAMEKVKAKAKGIRKMESPPSLFKLKDEENRMREMDLQNNFENMMLCAHGCYTLDHCEQRKGKDSCYVREMC